MDQKRETSIGDLSVKRVAELMMGLRYDALADFMLCLAGELSRQSDVDRAAGRAELAGQLFCAVIYARAAGNELGEAWKCVAERK